MADLPVLELGADAYGRGLDHGEAMAGSIRDNLATYLARFEAGGVSRAEAEAEGTRWIDVIGADNPDYGEEMRGIAEGAGMALRDVAMLNARYEIAYSVLAGEAAGAGAEAPGADGCTAFGATPGATRTGHTIIGQNWDWLGGVRGRTFIMRVRRDGAPDFVGFTEAGIAGCKMGVNEAGIGLVVNGLVSAEDGRHKYRKAFHVRCREALDAWTMDKALLPFVATDRVCSANILLGHAEGEVIDLETSPGDANCLYPEGGLITHANHFVHPRSVASRFERLTPGTLFRAERLDRLLRKDLGRLAFEHFRAGLSDHFSHPASICKHPDETVAEARRSQSVASIIVDLTARTLWASDGPPCENAYQAFPLAEAEALPETVAV